MKPFANAVLLIVLGALAGCVSPGNRPEAIRLNATMASPIDIVLKWDDAGNAAVGYVVEYTNDPNEEYVPLGFFPPTCREYAHSQLLPQTKFHYRVRPYYGPASSSVEVSLPATLTDEAYAAAYELPEDYDWAPPAARPEVGFVSKESIRNPSSASKAAPSDLEAQLMTVVTVSGFLLTWKDHANDEEGFLLERKLEGSPDYEVCAMVEPNVNSFGWAFEPPTRKGSFRIRPFYFGAPSNVVMKQTGKDPELARRHETLAE